MSTTQDASSSSGHTPWVHRTSFGVLFAVALAVVTTVPSHVTRDLWAPDEPRYMEVSREMVVMNDYVVLHLNGEEYIEKTPLFFWLTAGLYRAGLGFNSGRIVSTFATIGILLVLYWFGRRLLGPTGGLLAAAATATLILFTSTSKLGVLDPLLTFFITSAIAAGYVALEGGSPRARWAWLLCYAAVGFGILTKGPIALVLTGFVLGVYALLNWRKVTVWSWMHVPGVVLMLAVVSIWLIPVLQRGGPEYALTVLIEKSTSRVVESWSHRHGPLYYVQNLAGYLFPWGFFAVLATAQAVRDWRRAPGAGDGSGDRGAILLALWFVGILVLLSAVSGKRARYVVPLLPAAGLLSARYFVLAARAGFPWPRLQKWSALLTFVPTALVALCLPVLLVKAPALVDRALLDEADTQALAASVLTPGTLVAGGAVAVVLLALAVAGIWSAVRRSRPLFTATVLVALTLVVSLGFDTVVCSVVNPFKSGRDFAVLALPHLRKADRIYMYGSSFSGTYNLYTGILSMPVIGLRDTEELVRLLGSAEKVAVIGMEKQLQPRMPECPPGTKVIVAERVGHRNMLLLGNKALAAAAGEAKGPAR